METEFNNMNRKVKDIPVSEFFKIYDKVPKRFKLDAVNQIGLSSCSKLHRIEYITSYQYTKFKVWAKNNDFLSPNQIVFYIPFDAQLVQPHIKEVLNLINSPDFVLLDKKDKFKLTHYYSTKIKELNINQ